MSKRLIATVLAAVLAMTSFSAVPARADSGEIGRFLLGAGTLIIIGSALSNSNNRDRGHVTTTRRHHEPVYRSNRHHDRHNYRYQNRRHHDWGHKNYRRHNEYRRYNDYRHR